MKREEVDRYMGQRVVVKREDGELIQGVLQEPEWSVVAAAARQGITVEYDVLNGSTHNMLAPAQILSVRRAPLAQEEAEKELERLKRSSEIDPRLVVIEWDGPVGRSALPYGRLGILPNPYPPYPKPPEGTEFRVIYQNADTSDTVEVTGWSPADVLQLVKDRATAAGLPFPPLRPS